jgi:hypothetical protein
MLAQAEDDIYDSLLAGDEMHGEEDMLSTFGQIAEASVEHMKVAYRLTKLIVTSRQASNLSTQDILDIFQQSAETIMDCTPLKALFEKV